MPHDDVWRRLDARIEQRAGAGVTTKVSWCKAHTAERHVTAGITSKLDAYGNEGSDLRATSARQAAAAATPLFRRADQRRPRSAAGAR